MRYDVAVVGAGIVGLAATRALVRRHPGLRIVVLERARIGAAQTGHNSGVVHSGVYYRPGSVKAALCVEGAARLRRYVAERSLPVRTVGKLIVAATDEELAPLAELERRGRANGVPALVGLDRAGLARVAPRVAGVAGLYLPDAAIVDFRAVTLAMAAEVRDHGVVVRVAEPVEDVTPTRRSVRLRTPSGTVTAGFLLNCAGVYADRIARTSGEEPPVQIVPFRGEYYTIDPAAAAGIDGMVYPVPDPRFPFLGVHLTPTFAGTVEAGPNAVPAFSREGYRWSRVSPRDLAEMLRFRGFRRLARGSWRSGTTEMLRSWSRPAYAHAVRRLVPGIRARDLRRGRSGVRAQALAEDGSLVDDFVILRGERTVHVLNAPSPAATASLAIGERIARLLPDEAGDLQGDAA